MTKTKHFYSEFEYNDAHTHTARVYNIRIYIAVLRLLYSPIQGLTILFIKLFECNIHSVWRQLSQQRLQTHHEQRTGKEKKAEDVHEVKTQ